MTRWNLVPTALILLAAATTAVAQNRPPVPGLGDGKGSDGERPRIRMGDDTDAGPRTSDPRTTDGEPAAKSELDLLVESLATWPSTEARQASIRLAAQPNAAFDRLTAALNDADVEWRMIAGAAATLGRIGDIRALEPILAKLQDRKMFQHAGDLLDAVARIDPIGAKPRFFAQLLHPSSAVVRAAQTRLESRVGPSDLEELREIFEIGGQAARLAALELMGTADAEGAQADLAKALRDEMPEVCFAAARALADSDSETALEALRRASMSPLDRQMAYGYLGLAIRGDRLSKLLLDSADVRTLLGGRGLDHVDLLNRAVAGIALADAGYYHEVPDLESALDHKIVPVMIEAWINQDFWKDMKIVRPLLLRRMRRLTGRYELRETQEWRSWWEENRRGFVARRVLARVTAAGIPTMVVSIAGEGAPGGETTVIGSSAQELGPPLIGELAILLPTEAAVELATVVNESEILRSAESVSGGVSDRGSVRFTIRAGNRERRIGLESDRMSAGAAGLLAKIVELRTRFSWQRYRTLDPTLDFASFVRATAPLFSAERTPAERDKTLASLIVDALDPARGLGWNVAALEELEALPDLGDLLDDGRVDQLLRLLGAREQADAMAIALLRVIATLDRSEALPLLLDFITTRVESGREPLLQDVFRRASDGELATGLSDERPIVRVAAVRSLQINRLGGQSAVAARAAVDDEDRWVRSAAVRALGRLRDEDSRVLVDRLATEPGELRIPALEALGMLGGKRSLPILMRAFTSDDPALRVASVGAFADCGEPEGFSAIVFAMGGDPSPLVREVAANAIVRIGSRRAGDELRKMAIDPAQPPGPRARALQSLAQLRGREITDDLRRLANDASPVVADEAALALASWRDPSAVLHLIKMLEAGRSIPRARRALETISLESFPQSDASVLAALYGGWWELEREGGPRAWLSNALRLEGVEDRTLDDWETGRAGREVAPALLRGLRSERWFVRRGCDLALRDLLGRNVGEQEPWTTSGDVEHMAADWERVWAEIVGQ